MSKIEKLQDELGLLQQKCRQIRDELSEINLKKELPKLKRKYEGKFWKYENSTGADEKWWLYSYCRKVEDERGGNFDQFEVKPYNCEFTINDHGYFHLCQIEITKEEYLEAVEQFRQNVDALLNGL